MYKNTHLDRDTSHLYNIAQSIPKQSRWLSKDRFWNFVFWFGMSGGIALSFSVPANAYRLKCFFMILKEGYCVRTEYKGAIKCYSFFFLSSSFCSSYGTCGRSAEFFVI